MAGRSAKGFDAKEGTQQKTAAKTPETQQYQGTQDAQAMAIAGSMAAMTQAGKAQLSALQNQSQDYAEAFSDAASDILVSTQAQAWHLTAEKTAAKLGSYSPVDVADVFQAFSLDVSDIHSRLQGIAEPAALMAAKSTAGI